MGHDMGADRAEERQGEAAVTAVSDNEQLRANRGLSTRTWVGCRAGGGPVGRGGRAEDVTEPSGERYRLRRASAHPGPHADARNARICRGACGAARARS